MDGDAELYGDERDNSGRDVAVSMAPWNVPCVVARFLTFIFIQNRAGGPLGFSLLHICKNHFQFDGIIIDMKVPKMDNNKTTQR